MTDWTEGRRLATLIAEAEVAPLDKVTSTLTNYRNWMRKTEGARWFFTQGSDDYEKAVFQRRDPHLNLILAGGVAETNVAIDLWKWSEASGKSEAYVTALKQEILSGPGVLAILKNKRFSSSKIEGLIDLTDLLSQNPLPEEVHLILKNPYFKNLMGNLFQRKESFSKIDEEDLIWIASICSENPRFNLDTSDRDGPDLSHWDLRKQIFLLMEHTPATDDTFWSMYQLILNIERDAFYGTDFSVKNFCDRWLEFENNKKITEKDYSENNQGYYTEYSQVEEMVATCVAKFETAPTKETKLSINDALKETDIYKKAQYFGRTDFSHRETERICDACNYSTLYLLLLNDSVLYSYRTRELIKERVADGSLFWLYKKRVDRLKEIKPSFFENDLSVISEDEPEDVLTGVADQIQKIGQQINYLTQSYNQIKEQLRTASYVAIGFFVIWAIKNIF